MKITAPIHIVFWNVYVLCILLTLKRTRNAESYNKY